MKKSALFMLFFIIIDFSIVNSHDYKSPKQPEILGNSNFLLDSVRYQVPGYYGLQNNQVSVYSYDNYNNISEILYIKDYYPTNKELHKESYQYNSSNLIVSDSFFVFDTNNIWVPVSNYEYKYDSKNRLSEESQFEIPYKLTSYIYKKVFSYNNFDSVEKIWSYYYIQSLDTLIIISTKTRTYNSSSHRIISEIDTIYDPSKIEIINRKSYLYDGQGILTEEDVNDESYTGTDTPGQIDTMYYHGKLLFQYDNNRNMIASDEYRTESSPQRDYLLYEVLYKYDINNNLVELINYTNYTLYSKTDSLIIENRYLYYYHQIPSYVDEFNNDFEYNFTIFPNPVNDKLQVYYSQDCYSNVSVRIINGFGIEVYKNDGIISHDVKNSLNMNISDLPSGNFFCRINTPYFSEIKKFIIIR